ncbi:MAG TPA: NlpC/P60 family protein [Woeseiaceae bacterium]|nr:NlpC/P60 family protein [Woeseiaceae bacterium]
MTANFWVEQSGVGTEALLSPGEIRLLNQRSFASGDALVDLAGFPRVLNREALTGMLRSISSRRQAALFYRDGEEVTESDFARYDANLNLAAIAAKNPVRFGLVVQRAAMRTYPTHDTVYQRGMYPDLDRFQENGLFPADAVAVLHASSDGEWLLVQSYNYLAWVQNSAVAIGSHDDVLQYPDRQNFIVVTGDKVDCELFTAPATRRTLQLDMGVRLPLAAAGEFESSADWPHAAAQRIVVLPRRESGGTLYFGAALLPEDADVSPGYLPYSRRNLLAQSFKFLGEQYGWGHSLNARDCSGFIAEVYKSFGIFLPRNSDQQSRAEIGTSYSFSESDPIEAKAASLESLAPGDLIYTPGHVMMYVGDLDGEPYVIHDTAGLHYNTASDAQPARAFGVTVTPLKPLRASDDRTYVESISTIKKIG